VAKVGDLKTQVDSLSLETFEIRRDVNELQTTTEVLETDVGELKTKTKGYTYNESIKSPEIVTIKANTIKFDCPIPEHEDLEGTEITMLPQQIALTSKCEEEDKEFYGQIYIGNATTDTSASGIEMECDRPITIRERTGGERGKLVVEKNQVVIKSLNHIYIHFDENGLHFDTVDPEYPYDEGHYGHYLTIPWNANFTT
jgi:hypothetical protein